jgi:hypothetical protein
MVRTLIVACLLTLCAAFNAEASWYGCASYENAELESMELTEIIDLRKKNSDLAEKIYEDAAVQSILDKRLSDFRYMQYRECVEQVKAIDAVIDRKLRMPVLGESR